MKYTDKRCQGTSQYPLPVNIKAALSGNTEARPLWLFISEDLSENLQRRKPYPLSVLL